MARRNALGRGLGALIPGPGADAPTVEPPAAPEAAAAAGVLELAVEKIVPNPQQPRRHFDEAELRELAGSLERHGVLQPVVVRRSATEADRYELVVGERRWRAARLAGLESLPATVKDVAPRDLLELALVENVQRRDLNPIELALAFRTLLDGGATQEEVGRRVGLDRSSVANHVRLLDLPRELQEDVEGGTLTTGHAKALLSLTNPERRRRLRDRIVGEGLSVRATEELARSAGGGRGPGRRSPRREAVDPNLQDLLDRLRDRLKTRVRIAGTAQRGKLEVEFYGPEELHRVASAILEGP